MLVPYLGGRDHANGLLLVALELEQNCLGGELEDHTTDGLHVDLISACNGVEES